MGLLRLAAAGVAGVLAGVVLMAGGTEARAEMAQQPATTAATRALVEINSATPAELEELPGVGPALAARIVEYRTKNGGFKKIEELMNVQGIGERSFLRLRPLVTVAAPKSAER